MDDSIIHQHIIDIEKSSKYTARILNEIRVSLPEVGKSLNKYNINMNIFKMFEAFQFKFKALDMYYKSLSYDFGDLIDSKNVNKFLDLLIESHIFDTKLIYENLSRRIRVLHDEYIIYLNVVQCRVTQPAG